MRAADAFNTYDGVELAKIIRRTRLSARAADTSERMAGMLEVWADRQAGVARESAEVRAMLDCIK